MKKNAPPDAKDAIPNIGYIGFPSNVNIVDVVGLVTPDIARNRDRPSYWYNTYHPRLRGDKAVPVVPWLRQPTVCTCRRQGAAEISPRTISRRGYATDLATSSVRRSWTVPGAVLQVSGTPVSPVANRQEKDWLRIEEPSGHVRGRESNYPSG